MKNYSLLFKAQLKRIETWLSVGLIILVTVLFVCLKLPGEDNLSVQIYCEDEAFLEGFVKMLAESDSIYSFERAVSEESLKNEVSAGSAECGFVIDGEYERYFREKKQKDVVTYYCSSFTTKGEVAKETVYVALLKVQSGIFLETSLGELYSEPSEIIGKELSDLQKQYLGGDELFRIEECYVESDNVTLKTKTAEGTSGNTSPVSGTIGIILFVLIFLVTGDCREKEKSGYPIVLNKRERVEFALARTIAATTIPSAIGFFIMIFFDERQWYKVLIMLLLFIVYGFIFCYGYFSLWKKNSAYYSGIIILILFTIALCPVYIDLSVYAPVLKYIRWILPVGMFLV